MHLPDPLQQAIQEEAEKLEGASLAGASRQLTDAYQRGNYAHAVLNSPALRLAYLHVRVPATYAANLRVFREIRDRCPDVPVRSILDLGAGPGTSMWAASEIFPDVERFTLVERDNELLEIGRRMASAGSHPAVRSARWLREDICISDSFERHDLVILSYALGELNTAAARLVRTAWLSTSAFIAIIEPGTPRNFEGVLAARSALIESGAHIVAPCPHALPCPMAAASDWCHFSQRLERTSEHRRLKGGSLAYEDEKFSYLVAAKTPVPLPDARIVRHPLKHTGHVQFTLCSPQGLQRITIGKSKKSGYREARHADWGDVWRFDTVPRER